MRSVTGAFKAAGIICGLCMLHLVNLHAATKRYVVTNDDVKGPNTVTFYLADGTSSAPKLTRFKTISTGGTGLGGGVFGMVRQVLLESGGDKCVFTADSGSSDVAGILFDTQKVVGNYRGSSTDNGGTFGIGLALNPDNKYLYAAFSGSQTIATFAIGSGCTLTFKSDITAAGLNGGFPHGISSRGSILVVAYGDGSISSFNISGGSPVSNNDLQLSTGYIKDDEFPDGVDITGDGHFAIFGDASAGFSEVEVSDISSGKLTMTIKYGGPNGSLGRGLAANNVRLSPDESLLYLSDNLSGQVTATRFNKTKGTIRFDCISKPLRGYGTKWTYSSAIATELGFGTGSVLWVAEDGLGSSRSSIGIIKIGSKNGRCTLTESVKSPAPDPKSPNLCWLNAFPQRPF